MPWDFFTRGFFAFISLCNNCACKILPMSFVMYSTTWCGYCKRLKSQLADLGVTFDEINIEEVEGTAEIVEKVNGGNRTVPTLVFSDGSAMTNPSAKQVVEKIASL
jgi:mycoredoxin